MGWWACVVERSLAIFLLTVASSLCLLHSTEELWTTVVNAITCHGHLLLATIGFSQRSQKMRTVTVFQNLLAKCNQSEASENFQLEFPQGESSSLALQR